MKCNGLKHADMLSTYKIWMVIYALYHGFFLGLRIFKVMQMTMTLQHALKLRF